MTVLRVLFIFQHVSLFVQIVQFIIGSHMA